MLLKRTARAVYRRIKRAWESAAFRAEFGRFKALSESTSERRFAIDWNARQPCLDDRTSTTPFDRHYIYHPAWAARVLARTRPARHVDISSRLHFVTIVSAFIPVEFFDYRPAELCLSGLKSASVDLVAMHFADESIASLSCMHTVEHIGLGRYGDRLDPEGDLKAMRELKRVLARGGDLLFVAPVGVPQLRFNAHRIYSFEQISDAFAGLELVEFSLVQDEGKGADFVEGADPGVVAMQAYGCGCFWFRKPL